MLVLNRRVGEILTIGENISIVVLAKSKNAIRFGIEAPPQVHIDRAEVQLSKGMKKDKRRSRNSDPPECSKQGFRGP